MYGRRTGQAESREEGFISTCWEALLIICCGFCFLVGGTTAYGTKFVGEWADVSSAISAANQSYAFTGTAVGHPNDPGHPTDLSAWSGSTFADQQDFCDQSATCGVRFCQAPAPEGP